MLLVTSHPHLLIFKSTELGHVVIKEIFCKFGGPFSLWWCPPKGTIQVLSRMQWQCWHATMVLDHRRWTPHLPTFFFELHNCPYAHRWFRTTQLGSSGSSFFVGDGMDLRLKSKAICLIIVRLPLGGQQWLISLCFWWNCVWASVSEQECLQVGPRILFPRPRSCGS